MYKLLLTTIVGILVFSFGTYQSARHSHVLEQREFTRNASGIINRIHSDLLSIVSDMRSMGGAHQTSPDGFNYAQHEHVSKALIDRIHAVDASVRFDAIDHNDLAPYATELRDHGIFSFQPKTLTRDGELKPLPVKENYLSIIGYNPSTPMSNRYIGLDLNHLPRLRNAIRESTALYDVVAIAAPRNWVSDSDLLIIFPSYYGNQVPTDVESRLLQTDGGYLVSVSIEKLLQQRIPDNSSVSVSVYNNQSISGYTELYNVANNRSDDRMLHSIFQPVELNYDFRIGNSSLTLNLSSPTGEQRSILLRAVMIGLIALFVYTVSASAVIIRQRSVKNLAEKDKAIQREKERALVTLRSIDDAVVTADKNNAIDYVNPAAQQLLKLHHEDLLTRSVTSVLTSFSKTENTDLDLGQSESILNAPGPVTLLSNSGTVVNLRVSPLHDTEQSRLGTVLTMRDISKEHALTSELAHQAMHDALTGIPNRRSFENAIIKLLEHARSTPDIKHAVSYIDLDQFKLINDTAGHAVGDELLIKLSNDLTNHFNDAGLLARLGGDEFGLILSASNEQNLVDRINELYEFFQSYYFQTSKQLFSVRACIGMTHIRDTHLTMNDVLSEVDLACYAAKDSGRNNLHIYDPDNKDTQQRQGEMHYLPILQTALKEDRFLIYVQAIASTSNLDTFTPTHYECLLRVPGDNGQVSTPFKFILAAERYEMMRDIDRWVIHNAFQQIAGFRNTPVANHHFSINLSGQSAVDATLPSYIEEKLKEFNVAPQTICFELTETAVISNLSQAQQLIGYLRETGCSIALDDFGSGVSSFGYLKNLQVDYLKIDGQFVKDITKDPIDLEMVRSINNVGKALGIKTIAEFVETREIMKTLAELSVDYAQGYYVNKPFPMPDLLIDEQTNKAA